MRPPPPSRNGSPLPRPVAPTWHAAPRLLEYLSQEFDTERILPPSTLEGTYRNGRLDDDSYVVRELTLQRASDGGLIQLVQTEDSYDILDGFPASYQDRQTEETTAHLSAAARARKVLRVLLDCGLYNFLLRDKGGRLASELACLFGQDPAAARLLGVKERRQAEARGITLTRRP